MSKATPSTTVSIDRSSRAKPRERRVADEGAADSPTAVAAEALRTGVLPDRGSRAHAGEAEIPGEDTKIQVGDPDDRALDNEYVGDQLPGGGAPTPDQNSVDDIGRAYGLQDEDNGPLRSGSEILEGRDRKRSELEPPKEPGEI